MSRIFKYSQFDDYQDSAWSFDIGSVRCDKRLVHALGLAGEAGEVIEHVKKYYRDGTPMNLTDLRSELSDCQWYLAVLARDFGIALSDVVDTNLTKLADRRKRNVLAGRGDHR